MFTSKQAAAPAEAQPDRTALAEVSPSERIARTRSAQLDVVGAARAARCREVALSQLRTLCEDAEAALEPLSAARHVATTIVRALRRPVPPSMPAGRQDPLDEDRVLATLALVEELDSQLTSATAAPDGGRGNRAMRSLWPSTN